MMKRDDSKDEERNNNIEINLNFSDIVVGHFVIVNYEEELFPCNVLKKYDEGATISCMQSSGKNRVVENVYTTDEIVKKSGSQKQSIREEHVQFPNLNKTVNN